MMRRVEGSLSIIGIVSDTAAICAAAPCWGQTNRILVMMGKPAVLCQKASKCFCEKYGLCDLQCYNDGNCRRFVLPTFAVIPEGWPNSGEEGLNGWPRKDWWL